MKLSIVDAIIRDKRLHALFLCMLTVLDFSHSGQYTSTLVHC